MTTPESSEQHLHRILSPSSPSPPLSFPRSPSSTPLAPVSALSQSRPATATSAPAPARSTSTPSFCSSALNLFPSSSSFSTAAPSQPTTRDPSPSPHNSTTPLPQLITTLAAQQGESVLCVATEVAAPPPSSAAASARGRAPTRAGQSNDDAAGEKEKGRARLYAGCQDSSIQVWDLDTLAPVARLTGHSGAVLALLVVPECEWLVSASGDGTIRIHSTRTLTLQYLIHPPHDNTGDVLALAWVPFDELVDDTGGAKKGRTRASTAGQGGRERPRGRLFAGCQDTSIQWIDLPPAFHLSSFPPSSAPTPTPGSSTPIPLPPSAPHPLPLPRDLSTERTPTALFGPGSSSPPIYKAPNKFFDSLSNAEKVRQRAGLSASSGGAGGAGRRGSAGSVKSLGGVGGGAGGEGEEGEGAQRTRGEGDENAVELQFESEQIVPFAHFGYVYCLLSTQRDGQPVLLSGSGDALLRLWRPTVTDLIALHTLEYPAPSSSSSATSAAGAGAGAEADAAVLALAEREGTVFAGHQGGAIRIWDLDTLTCIRVLKPHNRWDSSFRLVHSFSASSSAPVLASEIVRPSRGGGGGGGVKLITGSGRGDASVRVWDVSEGGERAWDRERKNSFVEGVDAAGGVRQGEGTFQEGEMYRTLAKLVSFRTISSPEHREQCRQGALYLKRTLQALGADSQLLPTTLSGPPSASSSNSSAAPPAPAAEADPTNPLVLATFRASAPPRPNRFEAPRRKRVLVYGHYDVVPAMAPELWSGEPFEMRGREGWVYGRGVSDNKGPMLAIAAACADLRRAQLLDVDVVMLIEGEEETGSAGFQDAVRRHRDVIGDVDVILVSNSYWLGDEVPCLTFGLRGVIHATVRVSSDQPDLHSGIWGGVTSEPLGDLVRLVASLTGPDGRVRIPGFMDDVRPLKEEERALYEEVVERCKATDQASKLGKHSQIADPMESLITRWRQPALSVHKVEVPGPAQKTLIPNSAAASVSIRIVPDQGLEDIVAKLKKHLEEAFAELRTRNSLTIDIHHTADWWLGDTSSPYVSAMASCITAQWGLAPLFIREGGSIPSLPFLEREFGADAVHFPMGTSSDGAHLPDERIRILNLENGKAIVAKWLSMLASVDA
ncbi:hypothetical protein JCM10207_000113 [Rhodosporidiobolus poonsookiae]